MMTDHELVRTCLEEIYRQNGYDDMSRLAYRDHEHVSHQIESQTGTLISVSTLKRLLNGEFSRIPQSATLHALAQYVGCPNWQEYKIKMRSTVNGPQSTAGRLEQDAPQSIVEVHAEKAPAQKPVWVRYATLVSGGIVAMAIAILFIRYSAGQATVRHADMAQFSAQKVTANDIPNTVVFHYNIDDVQADSFFIQQSWDENRRVQVFKKAYTLTDVYYEPGYHVAKLIANDSVIKTIDVSIPNDGWFLCVKPPVPTGVPELHIHPTLPLYKDGVFRLDPADPALSLVDLKVQKDFVYSYHPSKMPVSSDNFTLKTRLRVHEVKDNACPSLMVEVLTQRYFMFFRSAPKGCSGELFTEFGEKFFHGRQVDLSPQAYDVTQWADVEIRVRDRAATVMINGYEVFAATYADPSGLVTGLAFVSNGLPEIDYIDLRGTDDTVFYHNDFDALP